MTRSRRLALVRSLLAPVAAALALWLGLAAVLAQDGGKDSGKDSTQDSTKSGPQNGSQNGMPAPPRRASVALEEAFRYVRDLAQSDTVVLAAQGTPEGYWRFVNRSGEMFTVGAPEEMKRVLPVLYPDARAGARLALYLTEDTVLGQGVPFRALPAGAEQHLVAGGTSYRLLPPRGEPLWAQVRPNVGVLVRANPLLDEAFAHLAVPLALAGVRVVALEPGGPAALRKAPPAVDLAAKAVPVERIDPERLAPALQAVAGATVVVCARGEGDLVLARSAGGQEHAIDAGRLLDAADRADVALIILQFASAPGPTAAGSCPDDDRPAGELTLADILHAAAVQSRQGAVAVGLGGRLKALDATMIGDLLEGTEPIRLGEARQRHVLRRLLRLFGDTPLAGTASSLPLIYAALMVLGLLGTPEARKWGSRLWRVGEAADYATAGGYRAARVVQLALFALVLMPATAILAAPYSLYRQIREAMTGSRHWRWKDGRDTGKMAARAAIRRAKDPAAAQKA